MTIEQFYRLIFCITAFILGACFGSFSGVLICRLPAGENIATKPSHCDSCGKKIKFYDVKNLIEVTFKEDEYVIPQSTISKNDFDILKEKIPNKDQLLTICRQCLYRWEQSLKVEKSNSLCFLVCGDSSSSNSIEFYNLLVSKGYLTYFVQNEEEATKLKNELSKYETVHVVSATSFPKELVDSIVSILES